jgi:hypothetical protein
MNTLIHPVAPEEIMALLDGELTIAEAKTLMQHIEECADCASIREHLRNTAQAMAAWEVPPVPASINPIVEKSAAQAVSAPMRRSRAPRPRTWRFWALASGAALGTVIVTIISGANRNQLHEQHYFEGHSRAQMKQQTDVPLGDRASGAPNFSAAATPAPPPLTDSRAAPAPTAPMIARTVSLNLLVKDIPTSRAALDAIVAQNHGYTAQLSMSTPDGGVRSFQASLRIPADQLATPLGQLRTLGNVENESQSGEEVTQQHADLAARLTNARETEEQLRTILRDRAGKMDEVLQVEEQIAETRGQIEQMEAEQTALEHRVSFATVDLQLTEEYKAQLGGAGDSVRTRLRNSFIAGIRKAGESLLRLTVLVEEAGPTVLLWGLILGIPAFLLWRRDRKTRRHF